MLFALALPSWQEIFEFRVSQLVRPAWMFWLFGIAVAWGLLVMWREGRSGVKLLVLGLGLQGFGYAQSAGQWDDFSRVSMAKKKELEAKAVPAAVDAMAKSAEVQKWRNYAAVARAAGQGGEAQYADAQLRILHQKALETGKQQAQADYQAWKAAEIEKARQAWIAEAPARQAEAQLQTAEAMRTLADEQARQNWLIEQRLALEVLKMRPR